MSLSLLSTVAVLAPIPIGFEVGRQSLGLKAEPRLLLTAIALSVLLFGTYWMFGPNPEATTLTYAAFSGVLISLLLALSIFDAETGWVPDSLSVPLIFSGLAHAWLGQTDLVPHLLAAILVCCAFVTVNWISSRGHRSRTLIGDGDIIIATGMAAWLGPIGALDALLIASIAGTTTMTLRMTNNLRFAPYLCAATWIVWLFGPVISTTLWQ